MHFLEELHGPLFLNQCMTKKQRHSAKKEYSITENYDTLYVKLTAFLGDEMRGLLRPGRIGETCLRIRVSTLGGDTFPRKNWRQICAATEKFAL